MIPESEQKIINFSKVLTFAAAMANTSFRDPFEDQSDHQSPNFNISSPLPTPIFFNEKTFSLKKERPPSRGHPPPTPKPYFDSGGLFRRKKFVNNRPHSISFIESDTPLSSKHYNENSKDLYFNQCFDFICKLGTGSFGEVFKVRSKDDGCYYAIKRSKNKFYGQADRRRKIEEVKKHERLPKHQNCVHFYRAWEEGEQLYMQLELCETSLCQYSEENHEIPESTVWQYLIDLLLAVKHLHDNNFIHLDIKPDNIFVKNDICKLGDFGLMLDVSNHNDHSEAVEGDSKYLAPELMSGVFTKAADVFSLGITILELACDLDLPQGEEAWHKLRQKQIPKEFLENLSPELAHVIQVMMEPSHLIRPSVDAILALEPVRKMYDKRKAILETENIVNTSSSVQSVDYNSSFSDEVFKPSSLSFSSQADSSYEQDKINESASHNMYNEDLFMDHEDSFSEFNCVPTSIPFNLSPCSAEKKFSTGSESPCMSSSSPKLVHRIFSQQKSNRKEDHRDSIPFLKPQRLLNIFDEQDSDNSV